MKNLSSRGFFVIFLLLLLFAGGHEARAVAAAFQNEPVLYEQYNVEIAVQAGGTLHIREIQQIRFNDIFRTAFAEIPLAYTVEIANVRLSAGGQAYQLLPGQTTSQAQTFVTVREGENLFVEWAYEPTQPGETRTFILEYEVSGGLWVYPDSDIVEWRAVPADRSGVPVLASQVTVTLPEPLARAQIETKAFGPAHTVETGTGQVTFTATEPLPDGLAFQVQVGFPHGLVPAEVQPWQRVADSASLRTTIPERTVELEITDAGLIQVSDRERVIVEEGTLYGGARTIPLRYLDEVTGVTLFEGDQPFTFTGNGTCEYCAQIWERPRSPGWVRLSPIGQELQIDDDATGTITVSWTVPPLVEGESTTFRLEYTAQGAVQIRDDAQIVIWQVPTEAEKTEVIIALPPGVSLENTRITGGGLRRLQDGRIAVRPEAGEAIAEVQIAMPAAATAAGVPEWQQELNAVLTRAEAIREEARQQEVARARRQLALGLISGLLLVGGLLGVYLLWYLVGRDEPGSDLPHTLTNPPSTLPPGIVAYLLDEKPTPKGVLASLFHLATLGLLQIRLSRPLTLTRNWDEEIVGGEAIETPAGETAKIPPHLALLFNRLLPHLSSEPTSINEIGRHLPALIPDVYLEMGEEANHFFAGLPGPVRHRWLVRGQWLVLASVMGAIMAAVFYAPSLGWVALAPAGALIAVGLALMLASRWMPRRSDAGAEEASRWRAFERYLRGLTAYGDEASAQEILNRYFAYAVALDVENVVLEQAASLGNVMPTWTRPWVVRAPQPRPTVVPGPSPETPPGPLRTEPAGSRSPHPTSFPAGLAEGKTSPADVSLEGLSEQLTARLEAASDTFTSILNTAVGEVEETPFRLVVRGARGASHLTWDATKTSVEIIEDILENAAANSGSNSYRGSSRSSWGSSRSSSFSSRSSGSRRSGGGGRRGFGR